MGGPPAEARDEWRRATAQAILGLQFAPASDDTFRIVSVRKQARAGERVQFRVYGLAPSESACMQVKGDFRRVKGKKSGDKIERKLQLPTGNQRRAKAGSKGWVASWGDKKRAKYQAESTKVSMVSTSRRAGPWHFGQVVCTKLSSLAKGAPP